jgi:ABC-type transport system involved in multi-copper enzyme maturation permease subunit
MVRPLGRIGAIALNTYRESVRARVLIGLAGVALAVSLYSLVVGAYTLQSAPRVVSDLGTAAISIFGIAVAIVIGATSLHRELDQKTIFPILARPVARSEYLVGKYLGTMLVLAVFVAAYAGVILCLAAILGGRSPALVAGLGAGAIAAFGIAAWRSAAARTFGPIALAAALLAVGLALSGVAPLERRFIGASATLALLEIAIVTAFATLFSSFSTPFLSAILTLGVVVVGRSADALARLPAGFFGEAIHAWGERISRRVPNLQLYVPPRPLLTGEAVDADTSGYLLLAAANALGWSVLLLAVAAVVFRRRDFT